MGVKSTHIITRETAMQILLSKLDSASDEALASMLEEFPESDFRNYSIVTEKEIDENDKEEWPLRVIRNSREF